MTCSEAEKYLGDRVEALLERVRELEAELEQTKWMLAEAAAAVCENYRDGTSTLTGDDVIADLVHRWSERERT